MRKYEDHCVCCPPEIGCLGKSCVYKDVPVDYCDQCGDNNAKYRFDDEDFCEDCANERLNEIFNDLSVKEKAEVLEVDLEKIDR